MISPLVGEKRPRILEQRRYKQIGPPYIKIGERAYYRIEDVKTWEAERTRRPRPESH